MKKLILLIILICAALFVGVRILFAPQGKIFERAKIQETKIAFLGDMFMDRSIRLKSEQYGYDYMFECIGPYLREFDFVIANMESPVTNNKSVSVGTEPGTPNNYRFTTDPRALSAISRAGINILGINNNHMYDFGRKGVEETGKHISESGIKYFGDPINLESSMLRVESGKNSFHLVSFNEFFGSEQATLNEIELAKKTGEPVFVFAHWGNEYALVTSRVRGWARKFVDAGASAVIGMHPHVVQETENYNGSYIAYSLGNFLFDQYFNDQVKTGAIVEMQMIDGKITRISMRKTRPDEFRRPCVF